ncbi:hypothetical protein DUI87_31610 [Hirundo rustica rustica]|uniref:Sperm surface protein Sp17 n=1 Tax=Hirundo rustica rustica TaxID=333673 RepID=A0A3M0IRT4_HIRRU|nr:hypothetical protein DUI87_31610 [Hirundo rustica rustica]
MSIAYSNTNMRVPAGFRNLLEGLVREVLREQPTNVVAFAAQHFQKLLEQREGLPFLAISQEVVPVPCAHHPWYQVPIACGIKPPPSPAGGLDPVAWGAMLEDDRLTWPPSQEGACTKLDEDILDIPLDDPDANAAAAKIQASFRGHMTRKKIKGGEIDRKTKDAECANSTRGGDLRNGD